ncbi:phosphodiester glycosidase family protein, partial [Gemmatimonadota bacterium]
MGVLLLVDAALLSGAVSCARRPSGGEPSLDWQPLETVNDSLPPGVRVFGAVNDSLPLRAWYVRVAEREPGIESRIVVSGDTDRRETAADFAERLGAVVVVNGGYFNMGSDPALHVGLLRVDGQTLSRATRSVRRDTLSYPVNRASLGLFEDGRVDVAWTSSRGDTLLEWSRPFANLPGKPVVPPGEDDARPWRARDAMAAGPALVQDGQIRVTVDEEAFFGSSIPDVHPRTAAGYTREGDLVLLIVDGRQPNSRGVDLIELATIMRDLGCVEALNLDGGGSSTLIINGRLINRPAGRTFQREVMSAVAVFAR